MTTSLKLLPVLMVACVLGSVTPAAAQMPVEAPDAQPPAEMPVAATADAMPADVQAIEEEVVVVPAPVFFDGSFFFTPDEIEKINQALKGKAKIEDLLPLPGDVAMPEIAIPMDRKISIGGVSYRSPSDWIVWMNGTKVTPKQKMEEIVDIKVDPTSNVHLKWYDIGLDSVLEITLRPHQSYDIVKGMILPGTGRN